MKATFDSYRNEDNYKIFIEVADAAGLIVKSSLHNGNDLSKQEAFNSGEIKDMDFAGNVLVLSGNSPNNSTVYSWSWTAYCEKEEDAIVLKMMLGK